MKKRRNSWPDKDLDALRRLWREGKAIGDIAKALKRTKNSIIGMSHRLGLPRRKRESASVKPRAKQARTRPAMHAPKAAPTSLRVDHDPLQPKTETTEFNHPVTIMELTWRHCRWIEGEIDGANTLYCGHKAVPGTRYCEAHLKRTIGAGTPSERRAIKEEKQLARAA